MLYCCEGRRPLTGSGGSGSDATTVNRPPSLPPLRVTWGAAAASEGFSSWPFCSLGWGRLLSRRRAVSQPPIRPASQPIYTPPQQPSPRTLIALPWNSTASSAPAAGDMRSTRSGMILLSSKPFL